MAKVQIFYDGDPISPSGIGKSQALTATVTQTLSVTVAVPSARFWLAGNGVSSVLATSATLSQGSKSIPITVNGATSFYIPATGRWSDYASIADFDLPGNVTISISFPEAVQAPTFGDNTDPDDPVAVSVVDEGITTNIGVPSGTILLDCRFTDTFTDSVNGIVPEVTNFILSDGYAVATGIGSINYGAVSLPNPKEITMIQHGIYEGKISQFVSVFKNGNGGTYLNGVLMSYSDPLPPELPYIYAAISALVADIRYDYVQIINTAICNPPAPGNEIDLVMGESVYIKFNNNNMLLSAAAGSNPEICSLQWTGPGYFLAFDNGGPLYVGDTDNDTAANFANYINTWMEGEGNPGGVFLSAVATGNVVTITNLAIDAVNIRLFNPMYYAFSTVAGTFPDNLITMLSGPCEEDFDLTEITLHGTITLSGNPSPGDTLTLKGSAGGEDIVFTFVDFTPVALNQIQIGADTTETATNIAAALNNIEGAEFVATADGNVITITAYSPELEIETDSDEIDIGIITKTTADIISEEVSAADSFTVTEGGKSVQENASAADETDCLMDGLTEQANASDFFDTPMAEMSESVSASDNIDGLIDYMGDEI